MAEKRLGRMQKLRTRSTIAACIQPLIGGIVASYCDNILDKDNATVTSQAGASTCTP